MKHGVIGTMLLVSALTFSAGTAAQVSEPPPDASLANPTGSTSALYTALTNLLHIGRGDAPDTVHTLGSMEALGYLMGIKELLSVYITKDKYRICVPAGIGSDTFARIVVKFIDKNSKTYTWPPGAVVTAAYMQAFPCSK